MGGAILRMKIRAILILLTGSEQKKVRKKWQPVLRAEHRHPFPPPQLSLCKIIKEGEAGGRLWSGPPRILK